MAKCDVLQGEQSAGSEGRGESVKDDFEHPDMLYPSSRNSNDTRGDGIFGKARQPWWMSTEALGRMK